jgi:TATA-box binding protein (TBP) (component of TFIID and TFIIIB)
MNHKHNTNEDYLKLRVENIVVTFHLGLMIDLDQLAIDCKHIIAPKNEFAACVGHLSEPECVFFVFSTGSVIIAGLKSVAARELAAVMLCDIIRTKGKLPLVSINTFKTINITLSTNIGFPIDILRIKQDHPTLILKNVGRFPNIVWPSNSSLSLSIFQSGKINVVGGLTIDMGREGFESASPELAQYKLDLLNT